MLNRLLATSVTTPDGTGDVYHSYTYTKTGAMASMDNISYTYDDLGRLIQETEGNITKEYGYDAAGNRISFVLKQGSNIIIDNSYTYDNMNRLITETTVTRDVTEITSYYYDYNGNQIYRGTEILEPVDGASTEGLGIYVSGQDADSGIATINEYDGLNRLIRTTVGDKTITYAYNGDGLRTEKTVNSATTKHIWDGNQIVLETDGTGIVKGRFIRGINLIYADDGAGSNHFQYLIDIFIYKAYNIIK